MAQANDEESKKLQPLTVPKIVEQLEHALMDIKYSKNDDDMVFNKIENIPVDSKNSRSGFIGKEMMLFEMIGILNGKISELEKKYQKIKGIEDREEHFVSSQANDITEPIQDILEYARLAKSGQMEQNEALVKVQAIAKKLQTVTTTVLDTNRITNESLKLIKKNQAINQIVLDIVEDVKSNSRVPVRIGLDHNIQIPVDKIRLGQVLQTVLNNSIKYTESGHIKVETFVAHSQNLVIIRINDTGKGIPNDILPNIFEKDSTENRIAEDSKSKLSLYLCKGIIEAHGGKISAKNNHDKGCTFTITLPIK